MRPRLVEPSPPPFTPPRLTCVALPRYRFVPTLNPHPCADPRGHSYEPPGTPPHRPPLPPPDQWRTCPTYLLGIDLYNLAYWWEAHETWEAVWQSSDKQSPQGRFLQALIQVSAAHLKRHLREPEGMQRLLERAAAHLDFVQPRVTDVYMGLRLAPFRTAVQAYFDSADGAPYPFIVPE